MDFAYKLEYNLAGQRRWKIFSRSERKNMQISGLWALIYYEKIFPALFIRQKKILWRLLVFTAELREFGSRVEWLILGEICGIIDIENKVKECSLSLL